MFPAFDYNHEKDEYRNGYDNGQGDKGYDDGENEFASNLDESDVMRPVNSPWIWELPAKYPVLLLMGRMWYMYCL